MGTRSLTHIHDQYDEKQPILVTMYRQYDGYPEGLGLELANFLQGFTLPVEDQKINRTPVPLFAYEGEGKQRHQVPVAGSYNDAQCLAAQIICAFKMDSGWGNVYIYPAGCSDVGEEYTYHVYTEGGKQRVTCHYGYRPSDQKLLFDGSPEEMLAWIEGLKKG